jgi:uncharacterized zinc-type alcohol dehydrogenase-like protein
LACLRGDENICEAGYRGLIVAGGLGGFQELVRVHADFAYRIPPGLDSAAAAPLLCAGVTVYAPLKRHLKRPGMRVGVLGVGGLGHLALQFGHRMGATVTALDVTAEKVRALRAGPRTPRDRLRLPVARRRDELPLRPARAGRVPKTLKL